MGRNYTWHVNLDRELKTPFKVLSVKENVPIQELLSKILTEKLKELKTRGKIKW